MFKLDTFECGKISLPDTFIHIQLAGLSLYEDAITGKFKPILATCMLLQGTMHIYFEKAYNSFTQTLHVDL